MKTYLVGGAVRDRLLDLPVTDRDWVVVGATAAEMETRGFVRTDAEFPVFTDPETGEDYALARRETKVGPGYKGFRIYAGNDVTLEEDLARRDLTINALAEDEAGEIIDLFGGLDDLQNGLLRHITPAFVEDPVRLLRVARFAARLGLWGFRVAHGTHSLMRRLASSEDLLALKPERVWREMKLALADTQPWRFFEVLHHCGALARLIPELSQLMADERGHGAAATCEPMAALRRATKLGSEPQPRFVAALHEAASLAVDIEAFPLRLRAEHDYAELLNLVRQLGPHYRGAAAGDPAPLLRLIEAGRALQRPQRFRLFSNACRALWPETDNDFGASNVERGLHAAAAVTAAALQKEGWHGVELGRELQRRRLAAIRQALSPASITGGSGS